MPTIGNRGPKMYTHEDGKFPSVTEVLKSLEDTSWIASYIAKNGRRELDRLKDEAAILGTKIHAVASAVALDRSHEPRDDEMVPYARAVDEFLSVHVREVIATELSLVSPEEGFGGTLDLIAVMNDGSIGLVDWKTAAGGTNRIMGVQLSGYALLLRRNGYKVHRRMVVRLHKGEKRGKWHVREYADHEADLKAFRAAVQLWHWKNAGRLKGSKSA